MSDPVESLRSFKDTLRQEPPLSQELILQLYMELPEQVSGMDDMLEVLLDQCKDSPSMSERNARVASAIKQRNKAEPKAIAARCDLYFKKYFDSWKDMWRCDEKGEDYATESKRVMNLIQFMSDLAKNLVIPFDMFFNTISCVMVPGAPIEERIEAVDLFMRCGSYLREKGPKLALMKVNRSVSSLIKNMGDWEWEKISKENKERVKEILRQNKGFDGIDDLVTVIETAVESEENPHTEVSHEEHVKERPNPPPYPFSEYDTPGEGSTPGGITDLTSGDIDGLDVVPSGAGGSDSGHEATSEPSHQPEPQSQPEPEPEPSYHPAFEVLDDDIGERPGMKDDDIDSAQPVPEFHPESSSEGGFVAYLDTVVPGTLPVSEPMPEPEPEPIPVSEPEFHPEPSSEGGFLAYLDTVVPGTLPVSEPEPEPEPISESQPDLRFEDNAGTFVSSLFVLNETRLTELFSSFDFTDERSLFEFYNVLVDQVILDRDACIAFGNWMYFFLTQHKDDKFGVSFPVDKIKKIERSPKPPFFAPVGFDIHVWRYPVSIVSEGINLSGCSSGSAPTTSSLAREDVLQCQNAVKRFKGAAFLLSRLFHARIFDLWQYHDVFESVLKMCLDESKNKDSVAYPHLLNVFTELGISFIDDFLGVASDFEREKMKKTFGLISRNCNTFLHKPVPRPCVRSLQQLSCLCEAIERDLSLPPLVKEVKHLLVLNEQLLKKGKELKNSLTLINDRTAAARSEMTLLWKKFSEWTVKWEKFVNTYSESNGEFDESLKSLEEGYSNLKGLLKRLEDCLEECGEDTESSDYGEDEEGEGEGGVDGKKARVTECEGNEGTFNFISLARQFSDVCGVPLSDEFQHQKQ